MVYIGGNFKVLNIYIFSLTCSSTTQKNPVQWRTLSFPRLPDEESYTHETYLISDILFLTFLRWWFLFYLCCFYCHPQTRFSLDYTVKIFCWVLHSGLGQFAKDSPPLLYQLCIISWGIFPDSDMQFWRIQEHYSEPWPPLHYMG